MKLLILIIIIIGMYFLLSRIRITFFKTESWLIYKDLWGNYFVGISTGNVFLKASKHEKKYLNGIFKEYKKKFGKLDAETKESILEEFCEAVLGKPNCYWEAFFYTTTPKQQADNWGGGQ